MFWTTTTTQHNVTPAGTIRRSVSELGNAANRMMAHRRFVLGLGSIALVPTLAAAVSVGFGVTVSGSDPAPYAIALGLIGLVGLIGANHKLDTEQAARSLTARSGTALSGQDAVTPLTTALRGSTDIGSMSARLARMERSNADLLKMLHEVTAHRDDLEYQMTIDPLTGVHNRRGLDAAFETHGTGTVMALLDLDHFKKINDTLGHDVGDRVLKDFARQLRARLNDSLPVYRIGGEEFIVLFPQSRMAEVAALLDGFRRDLQNSVFTRMSDPVRISFSAGLALRDDADQSFDEIYKQADERLYDAKAAGRARTAYTSALSTRQADCAKVARVG